MKKKDSAPTSAVRTSMRPRSTASSACAAASCGSCRGTSHAHSSDADEAGSVGHTLGHSPNVSIKMCKPIFEICAKLIGSHPIRSLTRYPPDLSSDPIARLRARKPSTRPVNRISYCSLCLACFTLILRRNVWHATSLMPPHYISAISKPKQPLG